MGLVNRIKFDQKMLEVNSENVDMLNRHMEKTERISCRVMFEKCR